MLYSSHGISLSLNYTGTCSCVQLLRRLDGRGKFNHVPSPAFYGAIHWPIFAGFAVGNVIGGLYGARHSIKKGDEWVRIGFSIIVVFSALKLLLF